MRHPQGLGEAAELPAQPGTGPLDALGGRPDTQRRRVSAGAQEHMSDPAAPPLLRLYDTLSREKHPVLPVARELLVYTCGPTVYNRVHIGNLRAFLTYDLLRRALLWAGHRVRHVMNLTDVDDKTIRDSRKAGQDLRRFTQGWIDLFLADLDALHILRPHALPRATDAIDAMVRLVQTLQEKGVAYRSEDGSVWFKIAAFPAYGRLSHLDARTLEAGAGGRVAADEYEKDSVQDFALWKAWTPEDGDVFWETPLGKGRPGWHLECSALAMQHLGQELDIHAGGVDLVFPHHENEIAQSEAATGRRFARLWVHNEHLLVGGKKMSKSLKNFFTLEDLQRQAGATPREVRWALLLQAHYRSHLNFQVTYEGEKIVRWDSLEAARGALRRLDDLRRALTAELQAPPPGSGAAAERVARARREVREAIADDLNVVRAVAALFELQNDLRGQPLGAAAAGQALALLDEADRVLGVLAPEPVRGLDPAEEDLFQRWVAARASKDWTAADAVKQALASRGIGVRARKDGPAEWFRT